MAQAETNESAIKIYYDGLRHGVLKARKCRSCGGYTFPPTTCCEHCGSWDLDWVELSGKGTLLFATHNIAPACHPRFESIAPYVYGHLRLEEGITVQAIIRGIKPTPEALRAVFEGGPVPVVADIMTMEDLPVLAFRPVE